MKKLNTNTGSIFLGVSLAVLLLSVNGWGTHSNSKAYSVDGAWVPGYECQGAVRPSCEDGAPAPPSGYYFLSCSCSGQLECSYKSELRLCSAVGVEHRYCSSYVLNPCWAVYTDNKCESDSVQCVNAGNNWQYDPSAACGKSCKINHCTASDSTWLSTSIASCTGSNNYAIVNTDSTCEHVGTCCPNDSIPSGNTCKWRCDSVLTQCNGRAGALFGAVLPDTSVSGEDTTFSYQCFYNCAYSPNPDSTVYIVEGNTVLSGPSDSIPDGIKSQSTFNSVRTTTGGVYIYDYLSPAASEYIDSIAAMKCVEHLWRCVINSKYVYWYDNQEVPAGCTNIVRVK